MGARTSDKKRVRSVRLGFGHLVALGEAEDVNSIDTHTFQDDVRVIGVQVGAECLINDADLVGAAGDFQQIVELSKHGDRSQPGAILAVEIMGIFDAATYVGGPTRAQKEIVFAQDGQGIDFDDGETINLHTYSVNEMVADTYFYGFAIVWYVER